MSQPKSFILLCGDGGAWLDGLVWSHWGAATSTATGVLLEKTCDPTCAAGGTTSSTATVTLTGLKDGRYTSLRIVTPRGVSDYRLDAMGPVTVG